MSDNQTPARDSVHDGSAFNFEAAMDEVDSINAKLRAGEVGVGELVEIATRGKALISQCEAQLSTVATTVEELLKR